MFDNIFFGGEKIKEKKKFVCIKLFNCVDIYCTINAFLQAPTKLTTSDPKDVGYNNPWPPMTSTILYDANDFWPKRCQGRTTTLKIINKPWWDQRHLRHLRKLAYVPDQPHVVKVIQFLKSFKVITVPCIIDIIMGYQHCWESSVVNSDYWEWLIINNITGSHRWIVDIDKSCQWSLWIVDIVKDL